MFAYVTLIYGGNKYLDGVILTGLGLRKQNVKYDLVCLITEDCIEYINIIKIIYDKVIVIPYITPNKKFENDIIIKNHIYENKFIDTCTKFNIFNKDILNYDKVLFVDSDLIPIKNFDDLFTCNTPAGWLEYRYNEFKIGWGEHEIKPNSLIPYDKINLTKKMRTSINGGLYLIEPNKDTFNDIINYLSNNEKFNKYFPGMYDIFLGKFMKNKYMSEQDILTVYFKDWYYISGFYNAWGPDKIRVNGIHMAGLNYSYNEKKIDYKTWNFQFNDENAYNFHTNLTYIYGINKYPELKKYILKNLYILINGKKLKFDEIKNRNDLSPSQLLLYSLLF